MMREIKSNLEIITLLKENPKKLLKKLVFRVSTIVIAVISGTVIVSAYAHLSESHPGYIEAFKEYIQNIKYLFPH